MFKVQPVRSQELKNDICRALDCPSIEGTYAFFAGEMNDELTEIVSVIGICQFVLTAEESAIKSIKWSASHADDEAVTIMVRAVMSFCYRGEVNFISIDDSSLSDEYIKSLGFKKTKGKWLIDLKKFYASPCHYNEKA